MLIFVITLNPITSELNYKWFWLKGRVINYCEWKQKPKKLCFNKRIITVIESVLNPMVSREAKHKLFVI